MGGVEGTLDRSTVRNRCYDGDDGKNGGWEMGNAKGERKGEIQTFRNDIGKLYNITKKYRYGHRHVCVCVYKCMLMELHHTWGDNAPSRAVYYLTKTTVPSMENFFCCCWSEE